MRPSPDETQERIPVAAPRPAASQPPGHRHRPLDDASGAGITTLVVIALCTAAGALIGEQAGLGTSGGLVGCFFGVVGGFTATYVRYRDL
ncbi:AtpZ/AtpI family protein [Paraconexibacter antarcticus]|uniref:AtpZ/AtpI family protein n=1 Tax=Paraconexibacter antarcticus TaxID=2949664 RepID=A0ABY5DPH2_9ACTN|nr:AtpZ/AtpI family protein [Paraconexibacter antarcticus]UTI63936.1 AtpZ/AtpI family protein [Paraconexibacter antarcticus]